jgi:DNA-binding NtrC family response regulator
MMQISDDPTMRVVGALAVKAARCRANILLVGESGVGKAFIARWIHKASPVGDGDLLTLFCLPDSDPRRELCPLPEQLRRHERRRATIFLRGVDLLSGLGQRSLLSYLDERERQLEACSRVHGKFARLIFSSQKSLRLEAQMGRFLRQLYLRVSVVTIDVPPLRQRECDIVSLANHFLALYAHEESKSIRGLSVDAQSLLRRFAWEGNIHELKNTMKHAVVMADDGQVLNAGMLKGLLANGWS